MDGKVGSQLVLDGLDQQITHFCNKDYNKGIKISSLRGFFRRRVELVANLLNRFKEVTQQAPLPLALEIYSVRLALRFGPLA